MPQSSSNPVQQFLKIPLVLVADDDRGIRITLRQIMEQDGYQVVEAKDGKQALEFYQQFQPDVMLLDALMPEVDGFTCCQQLQSLYGNRLAVVMITHLDDSASVDRAFSCGATDYVIKPIHPDVLRQKVSRIIQQIELVKQLQEAKTKLEFHSQILNITVQQRTTQIQQALKLETTLKRITNRVRDSLDETQVLQTAVNELALALDVICCIASLYYSDQHPSRVCYESATNLTMNELPELYQQLQSSGTQFCPIAQSSHQTAIFIFPIKHENQTIGDIRLVCEAQRTLDDFEVRLVKQIANQCAIATRQARLHQTTQTQVRELERLNQLKDDFLSTVSHELRAPIANVRLAVQMLDNLATRSQAQQDDSKLQLPDSARSLTYYRIIQAESERQINLINDLLDLQRLEATDQVTRLTFIYLEEWLPKLMQPFQERAQQRQQTLRLDLDADLSVIESDPNKLERVLTELLHNACKYTPPGETITLSTGFHPGLRYAQISVVNTGIEIPLKEHDRIFDKFYRIPQSDRYQQGGTGLGLALVKKIVESLNGSIQLKGSTLQTCFTIQLPLGTAYLDSQSF